MVIFLFVIFNSSYTTFFPFIWSVRVSVYDAFVFRRARQLTNISAEQKLFACQCDRQCRLCACIKHWCMPNFYSMINARFNERRTDPNRGDILSSHDKKSNTCTQPRARAHSVLRVCDHLAFLVFLCHKYAQASFFFWITGSEHDETISAGVYHKCYQWRLRGACAFVQSCRVTQSFGVDEESRHLRTPTN